MTRTLTLALRWAARVLGAAAIAFVAFMAAAQGLPNPAGLTGVELAQFAWLTSTLAGFAILWRWEAAGAAVSLAGMAGFFATQLVTAGALPRWGILWAFFLPGLLALAAWSLSRGSADHDGAS